MRILSFIQDREVIRVILKNLGLSLGWEISNVHWGMRIKKESFLPSLNAQTEFLIWWADFTLAFPPMGR